MSMGAAFAAISGGRRKRQTNFLVPQSALRASVRMKNRVDGIRLRRTKNSLCESNRSDSKPWISYANVLPKEKLFMSMAPPRREIRYSNILDWIIDSLPRRQSAIRTNGD